MVTKKKYSLQDLVELQEEARFLGTVNLAWVNSTFLYPYFLKVCDAFVY